MYHFFPSTGRLFPSLPVCLYSLGKNRNTVHTFDFLLFLVALVLFSSGTLWAQGPSSSKNSNSNAFTLTKSASVSPLPVGGGQVTYTYTVKNNTNNRLYFGSISDNRVGNLGTASGMSNSFLTGAYLSGGGTATWQVTQTVTQTTTNTVTANFGRYPWYRNEYSANTPITVTVQQGAISANTLWYSSDDRTSGTCSEAGRDRGSVGTLNPLTQVTDERYDIHHTEGSNTLTGSAAMAVDPANPHLVYYIPRNGTSTSADYGGLYRYDATTNTSVMVANNTNTPNVVRLTVAPDGKIWTISSGGSAYAFTPAGNGGSWSAAKPVQLSVNSWGNLSSGDLVFDGTGTMYFIAASSGTGHLYSISPAQLAASSPAASYIGQMGTSQFNGIAFTEDGKLWATASNGNCASRLYLVNILTGVATQQGGDIKNEGGKGIYVTDLGSGALPMPELRANKSVNVTSAKEDDEITYTIEVCNLGTLPATAVTLEDAIPTGTSYVAGSTTLNGASVGDTGGNMPFAAASPINSVGSTSGIIAADACAVITFRVKVTIPLGTVCNRATVRSSTGTIMSDNPDTPNPDATCIPVNTLYTISGNVFHDVNGLTDGHVNGSGTDAGGTVFALLIENDLIVMTVPVEEDGTFRFIDIPAGDYQVLITNTDAVDDGDPAPTPAPPADWVFTGENFGAGAGHDGSLIPENTADGFLDIGTVNSNVDNANFGIQQAPDSDDKAYTLPSPLASVLDVPLIGGLDNAPLMSGTDLEDGVYTGDEGTITDPQGVRITSLPTNGAELYYDDEPEPVDQDDIDNERLFADPSKFMVRLTPGAGITSTVFKYAYVDALGVQDPTPANYVIDWGALPVKWERVSVAEEAGAAVVSWSTTEELNVDRFEVLYSKDASNWRAIGTVEATNRLRTSYSYSHQFNGSGVHYYRVRSVDIDGSSSLSAIVSLKTSKAGGVTLYPNPVTGGELTLDGLSAGARSVKVYNITGIQQLSASLSGGRTVDIRSLVSGQYVLQVTYDNGETVTRTFIIK